MKNWDITEADRARAHSLQGAKLNQRLALSRAEIARHSEVLQRSKAGSAAYNSAWKKFMAATTAEEDAIKALTQGGGSRPAVVEAARLGGDK